MFSRLRPHDVPYHLAESAPRTRSGGPRKDAVGPVTFWVLIAQPAENGLAAPS